MRPIDADSLKENLSKWLKQVDPTHPSDIPPMDDIIVSTIMTIEEEPTIDAEPVRHGKWIPCMTDSHGCTDMFKCSECKRYSYYAYGVKQLDYKYCPHCGAKMDKERKE